MALTGKFCSLNQFFWVHFACGTKTCPRKVLDFISYGDNLLAVIIYRVLLSMGG